MSKKKKRKRKGKRKKPTLEAYVREAFPMYSHVGRTDTIGTKVRTLEVIGYMSDRPGSVRVICRQLPGESTTMIPTAKLRRLFTE